MIEENLRMCESLLVKHFWSSRLVGDFLSENSYMPLFMRSSYATVNSEVVT